MNIFTFKYYNEPILFLDLVNYSSFFKSLPRAFQEILTILIWYNIGIGVVYIGLIGHGTVPGAGIRAECVPGHGHQADGRAALHPAVEAHAPSAHAHIPEGGAVDRTATVAIEGQEAVVRLVVAGSVRLAARMQRVQLAVRRNGELRVLGHLQVAVAAPAI